ncbi:MAG TPA: MBL fold metallo-hydrolase [Candidatus Limnocylindria bacterium]|nr:MBL fold metallo-hydrolase [Candidatus Limnocylindria bacterium]
MTSDQHVAPGVRRIVLPLPLALRAVNVYLIEGDRGWSLVDSGMHTPEAEAALRAGLADAGAALADIGTAFITHLHPDHLGMAGTIRHGGARLLMHGPEILRARATWSADHRLIDQTYALFDRHGMPRDVDEGMRAAWVAMAERVDPFEPIGAVADGEVLDLGGRALTVIWTPGHTDHHAVLFEESSGTLIAGDHVLPRITSNVGVYPDGRPDPLGDFLGALEKMKTLGVKRVLPAHGEPFDDCAGRVDEILAHHADRLDATLEAAAGAPRSAYAICRVLFPVLRSAHEERFALAETLAHLRYLELRGRVRAVDGRPITWSVV